MMKQIKKLFLLAAMIMLAVGFNACNDNDGPGDGGRTAPDGYQGVMRPLTLSGVVKNTAGNPVAGVTVNSGSVTVETNEVGFFTISEGNVVSGRTVVNFKKDGYFNVTRALNTSEEAVWDVVICEKTNATITTEETYPSGNEETLAVQDMEVTLPADGYMVDESGRAYTGKVTGEMVYLDPNDDNFSEMMPGGDLSAVREDGSSTQLISYGMVAVNLTDQAGNKLQLKDGAEATVDFPIPAGMEANAPAEIPLWSFNEQTGLWEEEGSATLDGDHYVGTVKHFSWWNLDWPTLRATLNFEVKDSAGNPLPSVKINYGQLNNRTNNNGELSVFVPSDEAFDILADLASVGIPQTEITYTVDGGSAQRGTANGINVGPFDGQTEHTIVITVPRAPRLTGTILDVEDNPIVASLELVYDGGVTPLQASSPTGAFTFVLPYGLTGPATLRITTLNDGTMLYYLTLTGDDINVGTIHFGRRTTSTTITVTPTDGSAAFNLNVPTLTGSVYGREINVQSEQNAQNIDINMYAEGWDSATGGTDYSYFEYRIGQSGLSSKMVTISGVTIEGDKLYFSVSGEGGYNDAETGSFIPCTFEANDLCADLTLAWELKYDVAPREAGFPSWTPVLSAKSPMVALCTVSPWGNGGRIFYNGTTTELQNLQRQATAAGLPAIDADNYYLMAEISGDLHLYYSNKKLVGIVLNEYGAEIDIDDLSTSWRWNLPQLTVIAFDNVEQDQIQNALNGEIYDYTEAASARSLKRRAKK